VRAKMTAVEKVCAEMRRALLMPFAFGRRLRVP
jgi:hypothetical protein